MTGQASVARPAGSEQTMSTPGLRSWLPLARAGWVVDVVEVLALFAAGVPVIVSQLETVCSGDSCARWQLGPDQASALAQLGLLMRWYATLFVLTEALSVLAWCALAALIFWRKPNDPMALGAASMLVMFGGAVFNDTLTAVGAFGGGWWWIVTLFKCLGSISILAFFFIFPDGRFFPRWTIGAALGWVGWVILAHFSPVDWLVNKDNRASQLFHFGVLVFFTLCVCRQVYRYKGRSSRAERQQAKWVVSGFSAALAGILLMITFIEPAPTHLIHETRRSSPS